MGPADSPPPKRVRPPPKLDLGWLRSEALRYLEQQRPSVARLRLVLTRRVDRALAFHGGDRAAGLLLVEALLGDLERAGVLDDQRWARSWVEDLHRRGQSRPVIRQKLRLLGGDRDTVARAMEQVLGRRGDADLEAAIAWVRRKRIGPYRGDPAVRRDKRQRDIVAVARAGFPVRVALRVIGAADPDALEALLADGGD